jgi:hypothetical protein
MVIMQYNKEDFGNIKLTVGILRGNGEKIQYCITAIEKNDRTARNKHAIAIQSLFFEPQRYCFFQTAKVFLQKNKKSPLSVCLI